MSAFAGWERVGRLIEQYRIAVSPSDSQPGRWSAVHVNGPRHQDRALVDGYATPRDAVCALVMYLAEEGTLKPGVTK